MKKIFIKEIQIEDFEKHLFYMENHEKTLPKSRCSS